LCWSRMGGGFEVGREKFAARGGVGLPQPVHFGLVRLAWSYIADQVGITLTDEDPDPVKPKRKPVKENQRKPSKRIPLPGL
jgi:hypothetical protein